MSSCSVHTQEHLVCSDHAVCCWIDLWFVNLCKILLVVVDLTIFLKIVECEFGCDRLFWLLVWTYFTSIFELFFLPFKGREMFSFAPVIKDFVTQNALFATERN